MLMDYEEKMHPEGYEEVKDVHKIQGFQVTFAYFE